MACISAENPEFPTCSICGAPSTRRWNQACLSCNSFRYKHGRFPEAHEIRKRRMEIKLCTHCGQHIANHDLCHLCHRWKREHNGQSRPKIQWTKIRICKHCKQNKVHAKGLCKACYQYKLDHGKSRPKYLWSEECMVCGRPGVKFHRGRCSACRHYLGRYGVERPERLWLKMAPHGWCECGAPAVTTVTLNVDHGATEYRLCKECYEVEQGDFR